MFIDLARRGLLIAYVDIEFSIYEKDNVYFIRCLQSRTVYNFNTTIYLTDTNTLT